MAGCGGEKVRNRGREWLNNDGEIERVKDRAVQRGR